MTTPDCRTLIIEAEIRTLTVPAEGAGSVISITASSSGYWGDSYWGGDYWGELYWTAIAGTVSVTGTPINRSLVIEAESRTLIIDADDRTLAIEAENRTLVIEACKDGG